MKYPEYGRYDDSATEYCERVLLTIWPKLSQFHDDISIVGGLVPRYLTKNPDRISRTIDLDIAISLAVDGEMAGSVSWSLMSAGFQQEPGKGYFTRKEGTIELIIDFLTDAPPPGGWTRAVDDISANAFPGVERAIRVVRDHLISGIDLDGNASEQRVRVCEVGPYLCLKLSAYAERHEPKDIFDAVQMVRFYDQGPDAAQKAFWAESGENPAYPLARKVLETAFVESRRGANDYADFALGALGAGADEERRRDHQQLVGVALLAGKGLASSRE